MIISKIDRKIEYAVLVVAMFITYFVAPKANDRTLGNDDISVGLNVFVGYSHVL